MSNSDIFSIVSVAKNAQVTFEEKPHMKKDSFQNKNKDILFILDQTMLLRVPLGIGHAITLTKGGTFEIMFTEYRPLETSFPLLTLKNKKLRFL